MTQPPYNPDLVPCDFWLFPKPKSSFKEKRFQTVDEIQENMTMQLMAIGRTVWGPKVPTLKGTEASLSNVRCFLYLVSSSINISIFHIMWLDTFVDRPCIFHKYIPNSSLTLWRMRLSCPQHLASWSQCLSHPCCFVLPHWTSPLALDYKGLEAEQCYLSLHSQCRA